MTDTSSAPISTVAATYYLDGSVRTVDDGSMTTQYSYDGSAAMASRTEKADVGATQNSVQVQYDDAGLANQIYSDAIGPVSGASESRSYNAGGQLVTQTQSNGDTTQLTYSSDDTLRSEALAQSSSNGGATLATWTYAYDGDYRQTSVSLNGKTANGTQTVSFAYGYDSAGRLDSLGYDGGAAAAITYNHDGDRTGYTIAGTSTPTTFTYNADDSIASSTVGATTLTSTYDANGRLLSDGCDNFTYDGFDRKLQSTPITGRSTAVCGATMPPMTTYAYDGLDRQTSSNATAGTTVTHYDGLGTSVVDETAPGGTDTFYADDPAGQPQAVVSGSTHQWLAHDGDESVAMATSTSETVACTVIYDPNGAVLSPSSLSNPCTSGTNGSMLDNLLFHDGLLDSVTGQYQLGSRTYAPAKASYLTPDHYLVSHGNEDVSVGVDPLTLNRYGYVNGDPVNLRDPNGHNPCSSDDCSAGLNASLAAQERGASVEHAAAVSHASTARYSAALVERAQAQRQRDRVAAAAQQSRAATAHLIDVNGPRTMDTGAGTGLGSNIDLMTGACINCSGIREVGGRSYAYDSAMQTWVCGDRDAPGTDCGEGATFRFNAGTNGVDQYDDGVRTVGGWLGGHKGDIANVAFTAGMVGVQFIPGVDVAADAIEGARLVEGAADAASGIPDDALVVRGGTNTVERITNGSGVWTDEVGNVHDVSVNSAPGASVEELAQGIPNKQIGVTTAGAIREAGGDVVPDPTDDNPFHCLVSGLSAQALSGLLTPTISNPSC